MGLGFQPLLDTARTASSGVGSCLFCSLAELDGQAKAPEMGVPIDKGVNG